MRIGLPLVALALVATSCPSGVAQADRQPIVIGSIDYFGYSGLDTRRLDGHLPLHVGDPVTHTGFETVRATMRQAVMTATRAPATDIAAVCCDQENHLLLYIGLGGSSSRPLTGKPAPSGTERLDPQALKLYDSFSNALEAAVSRGVAGEDRTQGYALSEDAATRAIELQVREYALLHQPELERTLRNATDAQQRIASAWFLGYARRSSTQIQALAEAAADSDRDVRNNAVRALSVLSSAKDAPPMTLDATPLIAMLYSGQWTDRNKASLLLQMLTESRNPAVLDQLRNEAMAPLIEGARWTSLGHAQPFLILLGRIGKLSEADIARWALTEREKLIAAARR